MVLEKVERNFSENNQRIHSTHITELNRIELEPAREMGIKRFGLKHGVVIEERGGEALPIPYQDRAQMWSDVAESFWICLLYNGLLDFEWGSKRSKDVAWCGTKSKLQEELQ